MYNMTEVTSEKVIALNNKIRPGFHSSSHISESNPNIRLEQQFPTKADIYQINYLGRDVASRLG